MRKSICRLLHCFLVVGLSLSCAATLAVPKAAEHEDGEVTFGDAVNRQGAVTRPLTTFPSGVTDIYVSFDFAGFRNGQTFAFAWKIDGESAYEDSLAWEEGANGTTWLHLYSEEGLPDGLYTVEMRLDDVLLHTGTTTVGAVLVNT